MAAAENASSRKEARHLINESTKLMANQDNTKTYKPSRYSIPELFKMIEFQEDCLRKAEAQANIARQMIEMLTGTIKAQQEAGE